jgi:hypothetical protein
LGGIKSVYGHWSHCGAYKEFIKKFGKEARRPFKWSGYPNRLPKNWVDRRKATIQKPVGQNPVSKPEEKKQEIKKR